MIVFMILILQFFILSHEKEVIGAVDPYVSAPCNVTTSDSQCCVSQCLCTADNNGRIIKAEVRILSSTFPLLKKLKKSWFGLRSLSRIFKEFLKSAHFLPLLLLKRVVTLRAGPDVACPISIFITLL